MSVQDKEEADYVEWLKGQAELEGPEEAKDMVSVAMHDGKIRLNCICYALGNAQITVPLQLFILSVTQKEQGKENNLVFSTFTQT